MGARSSAAEEETQTARTEFGGEMAAVEARSGVRSWAKRWFARALTPSWSSWPWAVVEPWGGVMRPALRKRMSRRSVEAWRVSAAGFRVRRSERSRERVCSVPVEEGEVARRWVRAESSLEGERAAR